RPRRCLCPLPSRSRPSSSSCPGSSVRPRASHAYAGSASRGGDGPDQNWDPLAYLTYGMHNGYISLLIHTYVAGATARRVRAHQPRLDHRRGIVIRPVLAHSSDGSLCTVELSACKFLRNRITS